MPRSATVLDVLIASPGDVTEERQAVRNAIHDWNNEHSRHRGCLFHPVMWESHSTPEFGASPQGIINQIVDQCDAVVGIFGTRLGSPTDAAVSGTVEEIERLHAAGKRVIVYFSSRPVDPNTIDVSQLQALRDFKQRCQSHGLYGEFKTPDELASNVRRALTSTAEQQLPKGGLSGASVHTAGNDAKCDVDRTKELRQILKHWTFNARLGWRGTQPSQKLLQQFFAWYIRNSGSLGPAEKDWETLADLANQMATIRTPAQLPSGRQELFYEIGRTILTNAMSLMDSGQLLVEPGELAMLILYHLRSRDPSGQRHTVYQIAMALSMDEQRVQPALSELHRWGWVEVGSYDDAPTDYRITVAGLAGAMLHSKTWPAPASLPNSQGS